MSRIGKKPIELTDKIEAKIEGDLVTIKGPKGTLTQRIHPLVKVAIEATQINVTVANPDDCNENALWGLFRSLINNMVVGVTSGFEKKLEINGVGYKARVEGTSKLILNVGYSHPVDFELAPGIACQVEGNIITISGIDKQLVGETAANIRKVRKPEPYKGKGIKYTDEVLRRKAGKTAAKSA
ncbi:MAG: 50S ribosomal protein L6 [Parcubacteria group bacterium GW2011_GWC2_38_7]|nr:MAG: 50S ribosomal protein L6 [Parcubacteria group bacterium GW2011_GWC2_38_7]